MSLQVNARTVFFKLPQGKPDPSLPCSAPETRSRVVQAAQKGNTCWYYALNMMRQRIGKNPEAEFLQAREFEACASNRRKMQTMIYELYTERRLLEKQLSSDPNYRKHNLTMQDGAKAMLPTLQGLLNHPDKEAAKEATKLHKLLKAFTNSSYERLHDFVQGEYIRQRSEVNRQFLQKVGLSLEELCPLHGYTVNEF